MKVCFIRNEEGKREGDGAGESNNLPKSKKDRLGGSIFIETGVDDSPTFFVLIGETFIGDIETDACHLPSTSVLALPRPAVEPAFFGHFDDHVLLLMKN